MKIPGDVAIVGFDDTTASIFDPPLTAVRQDLTGLGREAVLRLLELIRRGRAMKPRQTLLQPELIVRNSSDASSLFCNIRQLGQNAESAESLLHKTSGLVGV